jgi:hypothetical protein
MKRQVNFAILAAICLFLAGTYAVNATTINGVTNQILSGLTAHNVLVGGGTGDIVQVPPSSTTGYALVSGGSSADPSFTTVPNAGLTNSSITFASSGCITASGTISLGGTYTPTNTCVGFAGVTNATAGATPTWVLASGDIAWTLSASATAVVTVAAGDKWTPHFAQICQPASGGPYTVTWPSNVKGGMVVGVTASKCSTQTFESFDGTNLYATSTGMLNQ